MKTKPNIKNILPQTKIDTIVHLGAGRCSELDEYLAINPRQLLLVEADPQLAEALQSRTADLQPVKVSCEAIAGRPGPATFHRYNLPDANSLHPASALLKLFPGLKTMEQLKVEAVIPETMLKSLQLDAQQENLLVIDLQGEELPVLKAIQKAQQLYLFSQVRIHCGREALYEGSERASNVLSWLSEKGFDLVAEDDSQDPDRPCWTLRLNVLQLRNRELDKQVAACQAQLAELKKSEEELSKKASDLQEQVRQLAKERDEQAMLADERSARIKEMTRAGAEKANLVESLSQEKNESSKQVAELQKQVQTLTQALDEKAKLAGERQAQIAQVMKERNEQANLSGERQAQIEELEKTRDEHARLAAERRLNIEQLSKVKDEQAKSAGGLQAKLEHVTKERDEKAKWASDLETQLAETSRSRDAEIDDLKAALQAQLDQVTKDRNEKVKLANERKVRIEQLTKERDALSNQASSRLSRIQELEARLTKLSDVEERQRVLLEEMTKAEAQIDLIKDVLLQDPGL